MSTRATLMPLRATLINNADFLPFWHTACAYVAVILIDDKYDNRQHYLRQPSQGEA